MLPDPSNEAAVHWFKRSFEFNPDIQVLTFRVSTSELYHRYVDHIKRLNLRDHDLRILPKAGIWGIIQKHWPFVTVIGTGSNKVFTGIRKR